MSISDYADSFILKGALMLRAWKSPVFRATMDIDMLAQRISNELSEIVEAIGNICATTVESDGLDFDLESIKGHRIVEEADYEGVRVTFFCKLDTARIRMQIDIGFGDVIYPGPQHTELPAILDFPPVLINAYSLESAIAEKFEAMIKLDVLNSRMKDFYDIWLLSRQFNFSCQDLLRAIDLTLHNRSTDLPEKLTPFSDGFIESKATQWNAFYKKMKSDSVPEDFSEVVHHIVEFLEPAISGIRSQSDTDLQWTAPGPWK